jgi:hypothetical protein
MWQIITWKASNRSAFTVLLGRDRLAVVRLVECRPGGLLDV